MKSIKIHPDDNVVVALQDMDTADGKILSGHKCAAQDIAAGEYIIKYGVPIGTATLPICAGQWVHTHNMRTNLSEDTVYSYHPVKQRAPSEISDTELRYFQGYCRENGTVGIRNEIWIIPTVGCVNGLVQRLAEENQHLVQGSIDGLYAFPHPFGCSQMGGDHEQTKRLLASLVHHPNAGGVLVVGLGCENNTMAQFQNALGTWNPQRVQFVIAQEVEDEIGVCRQQLLSLAQYVSAFRRETVPVSRLTIGMKCGGSDGLSGITANPTVGYFSDLLISKGGSSILTEVPEMFGAEQLLMQRCCSREIFDKFVNMIQGFKNYYISHGQVIYENPSPGNKDGGISTLEDKSCGCIQKGGSAQIVDVLPYAGRVEKQGLTILSGPGNDLVSATALAAAGAQMILFTTGRGTPFGAPVPTVKIATNHMLAEKKANWIDFDAGLVAEGESLEHAGTRLMEYVLQVASGQQTHNEKNGYREISIWKDGVVL